MFDPSSGTGSYWAVTSALWNSEFPENPILTHAITKTRGFFMGKFPTRAIKILGNFIAGILYGVVHYVR